MKTKQKVRNWKEYNESLKTRGKIIFTFNKESLNELYFEGTQKKGGIKEYTSKMYEYILTVKVYLRLPWRAAVGLVEGLLEKIAGEEVLVPHPAHANREANKLNLKIKNKIDSKTLEEGLEISLDSTGVNVYRKSGWHQTKHGKKDKCHGTEQWKKIHLALDLKTMEIVSMTYTESTVNDCEEVEKLLEGVKDLRVFSIIGDSAYDTYKTYECGHRLGAKMIIPPSCRAQSQDNLKRLRGGKKDYLVQRDQAIKEIKLHENYEQGLKEWKIKIGYHKRSRIESTMCRLKKTCGGYLQQKSEKGRKNEIICKINILNEMARLGRAEYITV